MNKSFLIARSNLRRIKGQTAAILVLILLAACMLNLWLMLAMDYKQNFDRYHDKLHAEHVTLAFTGDSREMRNFITETLDSDPRTSEYRMDDAMTMVGSFAYNGGEVNTEFIILEKENALTRSIGKVEIIEDSGLSDGLYMPMLYGTDHSHPLGEPMEITIGNAAIRYPLCGFTNSVMAGSHNCSMTVLLLTADRYQELEELGYAPRSTLVSVRLKDKNDSADFEAMLKNAVSSQYPEARTLSNSYQLVSASRYISQMICSGVVSAMAFFVLLISLVVIASNVIHYIQENMKNLGVLKASGYTSGQLIRALLLQFLSITLVSAASGAALSYCLFPTVNTMMISQTGIPYTVKFLPLPFAAVILLIAGTVALSVWFSSRRIRKIDPIVALRQGVRTHSFKRNLVPLEKTGAPLQMALALKTTLSNKKQNITVCVTMLVLSLIVVFSGLMTENLIVDMEPFINLIVGESADSCISIRTGAEEAFRQLVKEDPAVQKAYLFHSAEVRHAEGLDLLATISDDFSLLNNQQICYQGRYPKYDNEVALAAKYARENNLKTGDEITLTTEGNEAVYLISGLTQISNNLGLDCMLTRSGYERIGRLQNPTYYINVKEGTDVDTFNDHLAKELRSEVNITINILSVMEGTASVYVSLMTIIVIAILLLSAVIITFVLYLLVRTLLSAKRLDYGILKALGFTTGQLILQTAMSFMPTMLLSTAVGLVISSLIINPLTALFLNGIGIVKCTFTVPVGFITIAGLGLMALAFGMACLLSLKIRRITPKALLAGE